MDDLSSWWAWAQTTLIVGLKRLFRPNVVDCSYIGEIGGKIWQSGRLGPWVKTLPGPLVIVALNIGDQDERWINHRNIHGLFSVGMRDLPEDRLPDSVLLSFAYACLQLLNQNINIVIHCAEGLSRSTYLNVTIHCLSNGWSAKQSLEYIRQSRPLATMNPGFMDQLDYLFP